MADNEIDTLWGDDEIDTLWGAPSPTPTAAPTITAPQEEVPSAGARLIANLRQADTGFGSNTTPQHDSKIMETATELGLSILPWGKVAKQIP